MGELRLPHEDSPWAFSGAGGDERPSLCSIRTIGLIGKSSRALFLKCDKFRQCERFLPSLLADGILKRLYYPDSGNRNSGNGQNVWVVCELGGLRQS